MDNSSSTYGRIQADLKDSMKKGDRQSVVLLRGIVAKVKDETVNKGKELTEDIVVSCVEKTVKEINQSIDSFKKAGRDDSVEKLENDRKLVSEYLPKQLSEQETIDAINIVLQTIPPVKKNMGIIMKQLPKEVNKSTAAKILNMILK